MTFRQIASFLLNPWKTLRLFQVKRSGSFFYSCFKMEGFRSAKHDITAATTTHHESWDIVMNGLGGTLIRGLPGYVLAAIRSS